MRFVKKYWNLIIKKVIKTDKTYDNNISNGSGFFSQEISFSKPKFQYEENKNYTKSIIFIGKEN